MLHLRVFGFEDGGVGIGRDVDGRGEEDDGAGERGGQQEVIPGFFESFSAIDADVEDEHGAAGFSGEHDGAGLGDVTRAARAIDGESAIDAFFEAARHDRETAQATA